MYKIYEFPFFLFINAIWLIFYHSSTNHVLMAKANLAKDKVAKERELTVCTYQYSVKVFFHLIFTYVIIMNKYSFAFDFILIFSYIQRI